jgi:hypothetical protein
MANTLPLTVSLYLCMSLFSPSTVEAGSVDNTKLLATNNVLLSTVFLCLRRTFSDTQALAQGGEWTTQCSEKITKDLTR